MLLAAVLQLLAAPALAAGAPAPLTRSPHPQSLSWLAPVGRTFTRYGTDRIARLSPSLAELSKAEPSLSEARVRGDWLAPLAGQLEARGLTPERYAALPLKEQTAALMAAARAAEEEHQAYAEGELPSEARPSTVETFEDDRGAVAELERRRLFLSPALRDRLDRAKELVEQTSESWTTAREQWTQGLSRELKAGTLDSRLHFKKTERGWLMDDHYLLPLLPTLVKAIDLRLAELEQRPEGRWTLDVLENIERALLDPGIQAELAAESGPDAPREQLERIRAALAERRSRRELERARLAPAAERWAKGRRLRPKDYAALMKGYAEPMARPVIALDLRIARGVAAGDPELGLPPFLSLDRSLRADIKRADRLSVTGVLGGILTIASPLISSAFWEPTDAQIMPALFAMLGVAFAFVIFFFRNINRHDKLTKAGRADIEAPVLEFESGR